MLQLKVVEKSGLNRDGTFLPPAIHPSFAKEPKYDMKTAMIEAEMVMGSVVADVLEKTGIHQTLTFRCRPVLLMGVLQSQAAAAAPTCCLSCERYYDRLSFLCAGIKPEQVDILITNCSIFCPTPSLASMLINKFKFRRDIQSYNLGGMGCSIGVIAIGLVRDMLQVRPADQRNQSTQHGRGCDGPGPACSNA